MKKIFLAALAATVLFASCAKDENGVRDNGSEAKMDLSIAFPQTETRAADGNANAQDVAIETVTVFIFNADGTHAIGSPKPLTLSDFEAPVNNVYTLKEASKITTTSGTKKIYVGLNLPTALSTADEGILINAASTANLYNGTTSVAMLSAGVSKNLQAQEEGVDETPADNKITVPVARLVAKITVTKGSGYSSTPTGSSVGGAFKVDADKFTVGNLATSFYPVQRVVSSKLQTPGLSAPTDAVLPQKDLNTQSLAKNITSYFYVPEHSTSSENLRGEATYAVVRGKLTFDNFAKVVSDVINIATSAIGHNGNVYVVSKGDNTYFCASKDDAKKVAGVLGVPEENIDTYEDAGTGEYYTYYYLFINRDEMADRLAVYRNQFINTTVTGVKGIGVPGKPTKPEEPPVVPPKPEEPVFGSTAQLEVIVDVQKWDYKDPSVTLE